MKAEMHPITVFLYDDEKEELDSAKMAIVRLFDSRGVPVQVEAHLIQGWSEAELKELRKHRPEIIVFDNSFGEGSTRAIFGQERIATIRDQFPDAVFLLLTKLNISGPSLRSQFPQADLFIEKRALSQTTGAYCDWVFRELTQKVGRARIDSIDVSGARKVIERLQVLDANRRRRAPSEEEIRSIIEQVCHTGGLPRENRINGVKLTSLPGGKSGAAVSLIYIKTDYSEYRVPAVLKIMSRKDAVEEARNHAKFAKWVLPYRWRVDTIGTGFTDIFGAVCYSFAHGGSGSPVTLNSLLSRGDAESQRVKEVFSQVFDPDSQAWYGEKRTESIPLASYYLKQAPYFTEQSTEELRRASLEGILKKISEYEGCSLVGRFADGRLDVGTHHVQLGDMLSRVLQIGHLNKTELCLSHGDLNGGNILVAGNSSEFSFIDFRHTGFHHLPRDFCSLEGSVRTLKPMNRADVSFGVLFDREVQRWMRFASTAPNTIDLANQDLIVILREYFLLNHKNGSQLEYAVASFLHTLWLISFQDKDEKSWSSGQMLRLYAFLLATGHAIDTQIFPVP